MALSGHELTSTGPLWATSLLTRIMGPFRDPLGFYANQLIYVDLVIYEEEEDNL